MIIPMKMTFDLDTMCLIDAEYIEVNLADTKFHIPESMLEKGREYAKKHGLMGDQCEDPGADGSGC